jgi:hypothetical protein
MQWILRVERKHEENEENEEKPEEKQEEKPKENNFLSIFLNEILYSR